MSDVGTLTAPRADLTHFNAAHKALNLTPQEQALYMRHLSNVTGPGGVDNADGSRSTLYSTTVGIGDKTYVIPTVWGGKILSPKEAVDLAEKQGFEKFPSYPTPAEASKRYDAMHGYMDRDIAAAQEQSAFDGVAP